MPSANVHLLVARHLLEEWATRPSASPFPPHDPGCREAFVHGSLAPDAGFVPGSPRLPSELAHYWWSAELSRALLARSGNHVQAAFAWGWAAHALADAALHPLVGRTCGELVHGDRTRRMDAAEDEETHVAVETGLDIVIQKREGARLPRPPSRAFFDRRTIGLLSGALESTYGVPFDEVELLAWHRRSIRALALWRLALTILAGSRSMGPAERASLPSLLSRAVLFLPRRRARSGSAMQGFLHPRRPTPWLLARVYRTAERLRREVRGHVETKLASLENRNLETGLAQGAVPHAYGDRALERLRVLRRRHGKPELPLSRPRPPLPRHTPASPPSG